MNLHQTRTDALAHYTIEDVFGVDGNGNLKALEVEGRLENADRVDREEYLECLKELMN